MSQRAKSTHKTSTRATPAATPEAGRDPGAPSLLSIIAEGLAESRARHAAETDSSSGTAADRTTSTIPTTSSTDTTDRISGSTTSTTPTNTIAEPTREYLASLSAALKVELPSVVTSDWFCKWLFVDPERAAILLQLLLYRAPKLLKMIDFSQPVNLLNNDHFGEGVTLGQTDILLQVTLKPEYQRGGDGTAVIPVEHKSRVDRRVLLQLFGYTDKIVHGFAQKYPGKSTRWPPIFPLVVYNGEADSNPPRSLATVTAGRNLLVTPPGLEYIFSSLGTRQVAEYQAGVAAATSRVEREAWAGLFAMYLATRGQAAVAHAPALIKLFPADTLFGDGLHAYAASGWNLTPTQLRDLTRSLHPTDGANMLTIGEQLMAEGHAEGKTEGKTEVLMAQLHHKFDTVSQDVETRVAEGSPDELNRWTMQVLTAESPEEVVE